MVGRLVCRYWDDGVGRLLNDPLHRVCVLATAAGSQQQVPVATHGGAPGAGPAAVCYPIHVAALSAGDDAAGRCVLLVADSDNDRVKLLTGSGMEWICDVLGPADRGLCGPYRLGVDDTQTLLVVGCVDGRVLVYKVRDLVPASAVNIPSTRA